MKQNSSLLTIMEANTISKNLASIKTQIKKIFITIVCITTVSMSAFSQPYPLITYFKDYSQHYKFEGKAEVKNFDEFSFDFSLYSFATELKGIVKSIETHGYDAVDSWGEIVKGRKSLYEFVKFDNKGNITECVGPWEVTCCVATYKYNNERKQVEELVYDSKCVTPDYTQLRFSRKVICIYDDRGNLIEEKDYGQDSLLSRKVIYNYDGTGNMVEEKRHGDFLSKIVCEYDNRGKIKAYYEYENENLYRQAAYKYDKEGNIIEKVTYRFKKSTSDVFEKYLENIMIFKYDSKRNEREVESSFYNWSGNGNLIHKSNAKFDDRGNLIQYDSNHENDKYEKNSYKYNDRGDIIESRHNYSGKLSENKYEYKYDPKGNWVEKIRYNGETKIPSSIVERIIEYYE